MFNHPICNKFDENRLNLFHVCKTEILRAKVDYRLAKAKVSGSRLLPFFLFKSVLTIYWGHLKRLGDLPSSRFDIKSRFYMFETIFTNKHVLATLHHHCAIANRYVGTDEINGTWSDPV